jgi:hypothetical protein
MTNGSEVRDIDLMPQLLNASNLARAPNIRRLT